MDDSAKDVAAATSPPMRKPSPASSKISKTKDSTPSTVPASDAAASPIEKDDASDDETQEENSVDDGNNLSKNDTKKNGGDGAAKASGSKSTPKKKVPRGTSKSYIELVHEAILALKDRTGSSQIAIQKYLLSKYPNLQAAGQSSNRFKTNVLTAIKAGIKNGRFEKNKASYKIASAFKKKEADTKRKKKRQEMKKKRDKETQKKKEQNATEQEKERKDPLQYKIDKLRESNPDSEELKKLVAEKKRKEAAEKRKKYIAECLRKRRYPMEDTTLHNQDKEFGIKPPKDVARRPQLPFFFSLTKTDDRKPNNTYSAASSKCEGLENGSRGLVSDMLQVYHFFRGDVHYMGTGEGTDDREIVPAFSLQHLVHAVDDILSGTAKRARLVPPLIVHLFVTCLQILTADPVSDDGACEDDSKERKQLQKDFATHLKTPLSPTSWSDVCHLYMDAIHRHHTSEASLGKNVLMGMPIDVDYLLGATDKETTMPLNESPVGYVGYFGHSDGALMRAHTKLGLQDPWLLTAEELMALLRALTDDILIRKPEIGRDISEREDKMYELLKAKRAADAKFRKVRLAYEGPKKPTRKPVSSSDDKNTESNKQDKENVEDDNRKSLDENGDETEKSESKVQEWKPTATKKQYETAKKAQQKASDAYEKGAKVLVARTVPVGWDRNYNAVYCFRHDPDVLYVEMVKPTGIPDFGVPEDMQTIKASWHVIETKSLFDQFVQSLDIRGKRENALYESLLGPEGAQQSLRRYLYDDIKERAIAAAQLKEKEDLKRRLENAKLKCDEEEGRRSGRLASKAEEELGQIEDEIDQLETKIKSGAVVKDLDYVELTGLDLLRSYDGAGDKKRETRKSREKKAKAVVNRFESMRCSQLVATSGSMGEGLVGMLVSVMIELEETCQSLSPKDDSKRATWISELENLVFAWNHSSPALIGPMEAQPLAASPASQVDLSKAPTSAASESSNGKKRPSTGGVSSDSKRSKTDTDSSYITVSQAVTKLRQPLLDLEKRVFNITGLAMAAKDSQDADDNMSVTSEGENSEKQNKEQRVWKKILNKLHSMPTKRHSLIRELLVEAIAAARKAQLKEVVGQLRNALLEFHPNAAGACKAAALKVLELHGGYEADDDEEEDDEDANNDDAADGGEEEIPSALSADAVIVNSSLDGVEDAGHDDWVEAVRSAKTLSRMGCLITAFAKRASEKLKKVQEEREALTNALTVWVKEEERKMRDEANGKKSRKKAPEYVVSEVWANVVFTDQIVMAKVEPYPFWPAKMCTPKDPDLAASLKTVSRCLVSLMGEAGGLRVVDESAVRPFTGKLVEEEEGDVGVELGFISKETKTQLEDCMAMARRVLRCIEKKKRRKSGGKR